MKNIFKALVVAVAALFVVTSAEAKPKQKAEVVTAKYSANIDCHVCAQKVDRALTPIKGVKSVSVDLPEKSITVKYDKHKVETEEISQSLDKVGIHIAPFKAAAKDSAKH